MLEISEIIAGASARDLLNQTNRKIWSREDIHQFDYVLVSKFAKELNLTNGGEVHPFLASFTFDLLNRHDPSSFLLLCHVNYTPSSCAQRFDNLVILHSATLVFGLFRRRSSTANKLSCNGIYFCTLRYR